MDCSHLEDGDYSLGCSTSYVTCGNGIKHKRYCPSALVFDPSRKRCVHHEQCGSAVMQQPINLSPSRPTYANASPLPVGEFCPFFCLFFRGFSLPSRNYTESISTPIFVCIYFLFMKCLSCGYRKQYMCYADFKMVAEPASPTITDTYKPCTFVYKNNSIIMLLQDQLIARLAETAFTERHALLPSFSAQTVSHQYCTVQVD